MFNLSGKLLDPSDLFDYNLQAHFIILLILGKFLQTIMSISLPNSSVHNYYQDHF